MNWGQGKRLVKFRDHNNVTRTRGSGPMSWFNDERLLSSDTFSALCGYRDGNPVAFSRAFCRNPALVSKELFDEIIISEGPLFDPITTRYIVDHIQRLMELGYQSHQDEFNAVVRVITNCLLLPSYNKKKGQNAYKIRKVKTGHPEDRIHQGMMNQVGLAMAPARRQTPVENVYQNALMFTMYSKAVLAVAEKIDEANQEHVEHVVRGVGILFAVVKAILAGVPFGAAAGIGNLLDPISDIIQSRENNRYTKRSLKEGYMVALQKVRHVATSGYTVPGLNNDIATLGRVENDLGLSPAQQREKDERIAWGMRFDKWLVDMGGVVTT